MIQSQLFDSIVSQSSVVLELFIQVTVVMLNETLIPKDTYPLYLSTQFQVAFVSLIVLLSAFYMKKKMDSDFDIFVLESERDGLIVYSVLMAAVLLLSVFEFNTVSYVNLTVPQVYSSESIQSSIMSSPNEIVSTVYLGLSLSSLVQIFVFGIFKQMLSVVGFIIAPILIASSVLNTTVFDPLNRNLSIVSAVAVWYFVALKTGFYLISLFNVEAGSPTVVYSLFGLLVVCFIGSLQIPKLLKLLQNKELDPHKTDMFLTSK